MGGTVDALYFYLVAVTIFFSVLIALAITYFAIRYRMRSRTDAPQPIAGSMKLETLWTVIPFLISMSMFVWGANIFFHQYRIPKDAMEITVVGKQWMWKLQHPTGQREINELHVPVGTKVKLLMTTEDVLHSFYIPAFRIKQDVIPGRYTMIWFEATKPGRYHLFCAEYCGTNHSGMTGYIDVMEKTDFDNWLAGNANSTSPVEAGRQLYTNKLGCASCHGENGQGGRGPALAGLLGRPTQLASGQTVTPDEAYVRESILNPGGQIVAGYENIMPTFAGQISEEELLQLISFVKSLSPQGQNAVTTTGPALSNNPRTGPATPEAQGAPTLESQRSNPLSSTPASNRTSGQQRNANTAGQRPNQ
jgi:cytochrome c oxidase subunit II